MSPAVAVIDIGSNSIKSLVARRSPSGEIATVRADALDARISAGLGRAAPRLSDEGMARGLAAVTQLLALAAPEAPVRTVLVATSAVRDAANGAEFAARIRAATGHGVRILSGEEEANLIGRGLAADPGLTGLRDFYLFDLGGGSLECLAFRSRAVVQALSLPLGCVRLTERFAGSGDAPAAVRQHTREALVASGFAFSLSAGATTIGTGGTVATLRAILAARHGRAFDEADPVLTTTVIEDVLGWLVRRTANEPEGIPGLPAARADVFPAALATLLGVADAGGLTSFHHSGYNLRYGLAAAELESVGA